MTGHQRLAAFCAFAGLLATGRAAVAAGPQEQVRQTTDKLLAIVADPALKPPEKKAERRAKLIAVVDERFNWPDMTGRAMGRHWRKRTPDERQAMIPLFATLIRRTYTNKVESYSGEEIRYKSERIEGDYASVSVEIITKKNQAVPLDYRLRKHGDRWLVYDIAIEGVRLVSNYRSQFNSMLGRMSYAEFLDKLKAKVAAITDD